MSSKMDDKYWTKQLGICRCSTGLKCPYCYARAGEVMSALSESLARSPFWNTRLSFASGSQRSNKQRRAIKKARAAIRGLRHWRKTKGRI
jgi:hypothetical protein